LIGGEAPTTLAAVTADPALRTAITPVTLPCPSPPPRRRPRATEPMPSTTTADFQRAPGAPPLPATPMAFIFRAVALSRWLYLAMVLLETAHAGSAIMIPYAINRIISGVTSAPVRSVAVVASLRGPLLLFVGFSAGEVLFGRAAAAIQFRLGPRQRQDTTRALFHYLQHHSHRYLSENFAGALAHKISETALGVNQTLWAIITEFWPIAIVLSVSVYLLFGVHVELGLFALAWAVAFIGLSFFLARRCQPHSVRAAAARSETTGKIVDSITNLTSARLFARLGFERRRLEGDLARELAVVMRANGYAERVRWFQFAASAVLKLGVLYLALVRWADGRIGVGQFVMAVSLSLLIINEARNLSRRFLEFFEFIGNVTNGVRTLIRPHELVDTPDATYAPLAKGAIEFRAIDFAYPDGKQVFRQLSVAIAAGQRVGLVGLSGSGKSTFVSLLLRLYDPQTGVITIDGHDLRGLTQDALHAQVALIPQDPSLFHRTLRENIRYGRPEASDHEVEAAAQRAHAHAFITEVPGGYDALVGERGIKLSGGQRQRIAIARVILKDAPVLILDEATSSLDSITEQAIQETLEQAMRGKTVIVVAHRLSTIAHLDRILVFEAGRIVEDGTHANLLTRRGAYHRLWTRQSAGFLPAGNDPSPSKHPGSVPPTPPTPAPQSTTDDDDPAPSSDQADEGPSTTAPLPLGA
jgi:ATP-binding cassette subfamily B protein